MSEYLNEMIGYSVEGTAEWRREKAAQFPDDDRNTIAAEELERLAEQISALKGSEIEKQINEAHESINALDDADVWTGILGNRF